MRNILRAAVAAALICGAWPALAFDLYMIRHAETLGNATGDYSGDRGDTLTEKGRRQCDEAVLKLQPYTFDIIYVSPSERTKNTITPYLRSHGRTARILPQIVECCWEEGRNPGMLRQCNLRRDEEIVLTPEQAQLFTMVPGERTYSNNGDFVNGMCQVDEAYDFLMRRFSGTNTRVLLVTHGQLSHYLIGKFLGREFERYLHNIELIILKQREDGSFALDR